MSEGDDDLAATVTWGELLAEAGGRLRRAGHPEVEARWIVEEAAGFDAGELDDGLATRVTERALARFDTMLARREAGEPLQYVLGRWGFRSLDLAVDRRALIPRPETEVLVEVALGELDRLGAGERSVRVVDLGTGSGAVALAVAAERVRAEVWATDRSAGAVALARENLAGLGRAAARVRVVEGDWFAALPNELRGTVGVVVSNPPYVADGDDVDPVVRDWEPHDALFAGPDGLRDLRRIVAEAPAWLAPGGALVVELAPTQAAAVAELMAEVGLSDVRVVPDLADRDRVVVGVSPPA